MSYSLSGSYISSLDTPSAVFPERLIRPLPKRSLRSRLTPEAAEAIPFPPNLSSTNLPGYNQHGENGDFMNESKVYVQRNGDLYEHDHDHHHHHECDHDHDHHHHHHHHHHDEDEDEDDSADDSSPVVVRRASGYRSSPKSPRSSRHARYGSHAPKSSPAGPDGYDAFENTNNKKKRKIPTSGNLGLHQPGLSADLAQLGLTSSKDGMLVASDGGPGIGQYYGSGNAAVPAGSGLAGAGRGRLGRDPARRISSRNPLGLSTNGSNVKSGPARYDQGPAANLELKDEEVKADQGIISAAIANANATALLKKPLQKGQENIGVLDQQSKQTPTNTQFTFTCESDTAKGVTFPEQSLYSAGYSQRANNMAAPGAASNQKFATQGTQTSPHMAQNNQHPQAPSAGAQGAVQGKKARRKRGDVYAMAARQRRVQQEYANLHHPPAAEDLWICEFCEYESIFGTPPQALIRQYEIKDRKERRRAAEKRRLLEKAKLKGRKGKKQTKNAAAKVAGNTAQQPVNAQAYERQAMDPAPGDEDLDDGYDDDSVPGTANTHAAAKQPMPGAYDAGLGKHAHVGGAGQAAG